MKKNRFRVLFVMVLALVMIMPALAEEAINEAVAGSQDSVNTFAADEVVAELTEDVPGELDEFNLG